MAAAIMSVATKVLGGLFGEKKDGTYMASKGNVAFWVLLGHCMWGWHQGTPVPEMEVYSMWGLLGYAGFKMTSMANKSKAAATPAAPAAV